MAKQKVYDLPKIKRERVGEGVKDKFKVKDAKGKVHKVSGETYTEKEIETTILVKVAPLVYFCPENYKTYIIPQTLEFTPELYTRQVAKMALNFNNIIKRSEKIMKAIQEVLSGEEPEAEDKPKR